MTKLCMFEVVGILETISTTKALGDRMVFQN